MGKLTFTKDILIAASLSLIVGCAAEKQSSPVAVTTPASPVDVVADQSTNEMPPVKVEIVPESPGPNYVLVKGRWEWRDEWIWVPARWTVPPRPYAVWVAGHWEQRTGGFVWIGGHWR